MNYYLGNSVKRDIFKAVKILNISADRGHTNAQYTLGFIHLNGELVSQSNDKALNY
jgi:TPR repeat protein